MLRSLSSHVRTPAFVVASRAQNSRPSPEKVSSHDEAPLDLLEITGGNFSSALRSSALNAGQFLLKKSLPLVGGAVGGLPGLAAGAVLSGAIEALDQPEKTLASRLKLGLKTSLTTAAFAGGLGLAGGLLFSAGSAVQLASLGAGAALAGGLEFSTRRKQPGYEVHLPKLAKRFGVETAQLLKENGLKSEIKPARRNVAFTAKAKKLRALADITRTAAVLNSQLGPGVVIALAGKIGREGVDSSLLERLTQASYDAITQKKSSVDGVDVRRVEGLGTKHAVAVHNTVFISADESLESDKPLLDFLLGHELSHVKNKDSAAEEVQKTLMNVVREASKLTSSPQEQDALVQLYDDLEKAHLHESRQDELRADRDGMYHAQSQGHSRTEVLKAAEELVGTEDVETSYAEHPSGAKRMHALRNLDRPPS